MEQKQQFVQKTVKTGISFGSALAMVISYTTWHSVGWAIFHGLLSWIYVIYFVLRYRLRDKAHKNRFSADVRFILYRVLLLCIRAY